MANLAAIIALTLAIATPEPKSGPALLRETLNELNLSWPIDPDLGRLAEAQASERLRRRPSMAPSAWEISVRRLGLGDPQVEPFLLEGTDRVAAESAETRAALRALIRRIDQRTTAPHLGVARLNAEPRWVMAVVVADRPVAWNTPRQEGSRTSFSGRATHRMELEVLSFGPCVDPLRCKASLRVRPLLPTAQPRFHLERPDGPGRWVVEVVDPARGRPVVGWWFFDRGSVRKFRAAGAHPDWVGALRQAQGRPALSVDAQLTMAANARAREVCADGQAEHRRGPLAENVAVAHSSLRAFRNLLWSPSHRHLMLDRRALGFGVGEASDPGPPHRQCLVQLFGYGR